MSHTDSSEPDLAVLPAAAEGAEFTRAEAGLTGTYGYPLASADPLAPLARDHDRYSTYRDTRQALNAALGRVLRAFRYRSRAVRIPRRMASDRSRGQGMEAGR